MGKKKYTDEEFTNAVSCSLSVRQTLKLLGLNATGGNYSSFYRKVKELNLDISHFTGMLWSKGKTFGPKLDLQEYLIENSSITSHKLRLRLISEGVKEACCEICHNVTWLNNPIPLELDHINGNHSDNRLENLRILCPNCHSLTPTHRGKNWGKRSGLARY